jgi:hypothetical protein
MILVAHWQTPKEHWTLRDYDLTLFLDPFAEIDHGSNVGETLHSE